MPETAANDKSGHIYGRGRVRLARKFQSQTTRRQLRRD